MNKKKKKALLVLIIVTLAAIAVFALLTIGLVAFFPILITFVVFLLGMGAKWCFEWLVKNIHIFKLKEKGIKVKEKLRIKEGVDLVKDSIEILKEKDGEK